MRVAIDPGHGGIDRRNVGPTGYVEADGVLDMAFACREELQNAGIEVVMTRQSDRTVSIWKRADIINQSDVVLVVSIHTNAVSDPQVRGIEVIHSIHGEAGERLAGVMYDRLAEELQIPKRRKFTRIGDEGRDYYGIIRDTVPPCVIVEVEFHTHLEAEQLLKNHGFRKRAGISIARGIVQYLEGR